MLRPPKNAHFEKEMMNKKVFLNGVLGRLQNDAGKYFEFVLQHNQTNKDAIGFWGTVRLLMPVVEAVANAYQKRPATLLQEMGVKTPNLIWILYRHSLIHNDLIQHGRYNGVDATWGVSMFGHNHIIQHEVVGLDTLTLYNDLVAYLEREIKECDEDAEVEIIRGVVWDKPSQSIIDEFSKITPPAQD